MTTTSVAPQSDSVRSGQPPATGWPRPTVAATRPVRASELEAKPISWLWPGRIPLGLMTYLAGEPGLGKSLLSLLVVARLSRGELSDSASNSLILSAEDARAQVVVPRLQAAEANLERVFFPPLDGDGFEQQLLLPNDLQRLRLLIEQVEAKLVVIDPLVAHLPVQINSWQDQSVRMALAPLHHLAVDTGTAFLLIGHLNKAEGSNPMRRIGGSIGIPAAVRSVLLLARDPDDPAGESGSRRVLAHVKGNVGSLSPSLAYTLQTTTVGVNESIETVRMVEGGCSPFLGSQLLGEQRRPAKLDQATQMLRSELADGPKSVTDIRARASEHGISETTLARAKQDLGLLSRKAGLSDGWTWEIPETIGPDSPQE